MNWDELLEGIRAVREAVESVDARIGDINQSDIPPCRHCGGKLEITNNIRQRRWYAWCPSEKRSWGHSDTASGAIQAHLNS